MEAMVRPYLSDAVAYYQFRTTAQHVACGGICAAGDPQYRLRPLRPAGGRDPGRPPVEALLSPLRQAHDGRWRQVAALCLDMVISIVNKRPLWPPC